MPNEQIFIETTVESSWVKRCPHCLMTFAILIRLQADPTKFVLGVVVFCPSCGYEIKGERYADNSRDSRT